MLHSSGREDYMQYLHHRDLRIGLRGEGEGRSRTRRGRTELVGLAGVEGRRGVDGLGRREGSKGGEAGGDGELDL
jgi:hypothetical protein